MSFSRELDLLSRSAFLFTVKGCCCGGVLGVGGKAGLAHCYFFFFLLLFLSCSRMPGPGGGGGVVFARSSL